MRWSERVAATWSAWQEKHRQSRIRKHRKRLHARLWRANDIILHELHGRSCANGAYRQELEDCAEAIEQATSRIRADQSRT